MMIKKFINKHVNKKVCIISNEKTNSLVANIDKLKKAL